MLKRKARTFIATSSGHWSFTPSSNLADGAHTIKVVASDSAGNGSNVSQELNLTIDTQAPNPPSKPQLSPSTDSGTTGDGITNHSAPTFVGSAEAGSLVNIYQGSTLLDQTQADNMGQWSYSAQPLQDGNSSITAVAFDSAGNQSSSSPALSLSIDTSSPTVPSQVKILASTDSGQKGDNVTSYSNPTISGSADPGSKIIVWDGSSVLGQTYSDQQGQWALATSNLNDGVHNLKIASQDVAANTSAQATLDLTIDTQAPQASTPRLLPQSDSGAIGDGQTNNNNPTFVGNAEAGNSIDIYRDGQLIGKTNADGAGSWSYTSNTVLGDGNYHIQSVETDRAGNVSALSSPLLLSIDTSAPAMPGSPSLAPGSDTGVVGDGITNNAMPVFIGSAEVGSTIKVYNNKVLMGQASTDSHGNWEYSVASALADGNYNITVAAKDTAGNSSASSPGMAILIDTSAPNATMPQIAPGSDTGTLGDGITSNPQPTLQGQADAMSTVTLYINNNLLGAVQADSSGKWAYTPTNALADGIYTVTSVVTDQAGNTSAFSSPFNLIIDNKSAVVIEIGTQTQSNNEGDSIGAGSTITFTVATDKPVVVDTTGGIPSLTLNDGEQAAYQNSTDSTHLVFTAKVGPNDTINNLKVTGVNLNGGRILDGAGNSINLINTSSAPGSNTGIVVGDPVASGASGPVFRFFNTHDGSHFYTPSSTEKEAVQSSRADLIYEGKSFGSLDHTDQTGTGLFRFFDKNNGSHFFTTNSGERDTLIQTRSDLTYEGTSFYEHLTQQSGDVAVYRFFSLDNGSHLYTSDESEKNSVSALANYKYEGVAFWAPHL